MAYIRKMIAHDEKLIGIARLHWIYVIKGLIWFLGLAFAGWAVDQLITRGLFMIAQSTGATGMSAMLLTFSHNAMLFMMAAGFYIFFLFVLKVLVTEVGLSNRRIMLKEGLIFVKVKQVDIEEIRGENMDSGHLGRILGYAYIMLDCRFIGDVRLPAIENPERFMRALHQTRGISQDTLNVVLGKNNPMALGIVGSGPDMPQPNTPQPTPEILPGQQPGQPEVAPPNTPEPEIRPTPVPHSPPPAAPPQQPSQPPAQPPQPTPPPINPEPPLQPPSGVQNRNAPIVPPVVAQSVTLPPDAVAQVVQQVMPQMAQQVVKEMTEQGLIHPEDPANDQIDIDTDLMDSFDDARLDKDGNGNDLRDKMEYAIH